MKQILAFVAASLISTSVVHGAAIDWQMSGMNSALKDFAGNVAANTTVYFVLADTASIATISDTSSATDFENALKEITLSSITTGDDGKKPASLAPNYTIVVESPKLTSGTSYTFGMLYTSKDDEGNGVYRLLADSSTTAAYDSSDPSSSQATSLSWSNMGKASWDKGYSVPEPSVALMGLLGLGMLLKRRSA